jgi:flagellar hook-associated protein 3 FlgL
MRGISVGDMTRTFQMQRQMTALKTDISRLSAEVTTGQVNDLGKHLKGNHALVTALDSSLNRLRAFASTTTEAGLQAAAMQAAMGSMDALVSPLTNDLLNAATSGATGSLAALGRDGHERFKAVVSLLNGFVGDRALFGGQQTDQPPLLPADAILAELESVLLAAAPATLADVTGIIATWFDDPAGFASFAYQGAASRSGFTVGEGEAVSLRATAIDPAFRETLKGLAAPALLDRGMLSLDLAARQEFASWGGETLLRAQGQRTLLAVDIGIAEARIEQAQARNTATASALSLARVKLTEADPYAASVALQSAQTQLESLFAITARLSRLNLTEYLR